MTQAALDPRTSSYAPSRRREQGWLSPALTGALLMSLSFHAVPVLQAIRDLVEVRQFVGEARAVMHDFLWTTYEVEPPPPPKVQEQEKPKEPEPEPEPAPAPAPKPVVQPQAKPAEAKPVEAKPAEPPPAAAQAGKTLTAADDVADFSNDFTMVQGDGRYAGGTTAAKGTATTAVRDPNAKEGGVPGGKGSAEAPPPPPPPNEPDRSRPARPANAAWSCSHLFPPEADAEGIDNATVSIAVTVRPDGSVQSVKVLSDPGNGFGRAARTCALSQRFEPAFDRSGQPTTATTAPFTVRFTRLASTAPASPPGGARLYPPAPMPESAREPENFSPYLRFSEAEWSKLRAATPLPLTEGELAGLRGINERLSLREVENFYLPLSRLLNLHVAATQGLHRATDAFLGQSSAKMPYVIGIAGSVAVGKSTTARVLQALLARWPDHPRVALVTTDGFLHPNRVLTERSLMNRKGFPESYDVRRLLRFMIDLKSGQNEVRAPVYSHIAYDILPEQEQVVERPDILILEGLNVLQARTHPERLGPQVFVSDFFDFSIYVDADEAQIQRWYVDRFLKLRDTAFRDPQAYFHRYASLTEEEAVETALRIWREINGLNLHENIAPTRTRADLILEKGPDHAVRSVLLRKL